MKDKLKAQLLLVKVAPVQQRKKRETERRRESQSHKKTAICMNQQALIHIKIYKS